MMEQNEATAAFLLQTVNDYEAHATLRATLKRAMRTRAAMVDVDDEMQEAAEIKSALRPVREHLGSYGMNRVQWTLVTEHYLGDILDSPSETQHIGVSDGLRKRAAEWSDLEGYRNVRRWIKAADTTRA